MTFYALRKKKLRHGNEFIYVQNSAEMRETEGKSCTLTFLFMLLYCYMKKWPPTKIHAILEISGGHNFSWPRIFN